MKKLLIFVLAVVSLGVAQTSATGALTVAASTCAGNGPTCANLVLADPYTGAVGIDISGTFSATASFEASFDGKDLSDSTKTWRAVSVTPVASTTTVTSATAGGAWRVAVSGMTDIRVRCSAWASGTIVVALRSARQAASISGSAVYASGSGTNNVIPKGNGAGALADSSITDAGTTVVFAEPLQLSDGAALTPSLNFAGATTSGLARIGATSFSLVSGGAEKSRVISAGLAADNFVSNIANQDFNIARTAAGVGAVGSGTSGTSSGTLNLATVQYRGLAQTYFVTSDFTTSGSGTALELITGLSWTFPASIAMNVKVDCYLNYNQNVAAVAVAFGFQDATIAPTNLGAWARMGTNTTVFTAGTLAASTTTTATAVVSATPSAITTIWPAELHFFIEQPSNASTSIFSVRVSTATQGDTVTIKRGSYCTLQQ